MHTNLISFNLVLLIILAAAAVMTVMTRSLLRSAIGLALTSGVLSILMFRMLAPLAAVFELSVCAGLISVVFISAISLSQPLTQKEAIEHMKGRLHRFVFLPFIVIAVGVVLLLLKVSVDLHTPPVVMSQDVRQVLWHVRQIDLLGQAILLIVGVFGVVILFREKKER